MCELTVVDTQVGDGQPEDGRLVHLLVGLHDEGHNLGQLPDVRVEAVTPQLLTLIP